MIERRSERVTTKIFALNTAAGDVTLGALFKTPTIGVEPQLNEWNIDVLTNLPSGVAAEPSGFRHLQTHPTFKQVLSSGVDNPGTNFGPLDFSATNVSSGIGISCTRCMTFRADQFECPTTRLSNMRVWASDLGDFLLPEAFEIIFQTRRTGDWPSGIQLAVGTIFDSSLHLPRSLPTLQNLYRQDGGGTIHGSGDADVSEYMLLAVAASGCLPLGEYLGNPGFQLRVTYNVDNIFTLFD